MKNLILIAYRNLISHWQQSIASIISIAAAFFTICTFHGYLADVEKLFISISEQRLMLGQVIIEDRELMTAAGRAEPWKYSITPEKQDQIFDILKNESNIQNVVRYLRIQGNISNQKTRLIFSGYGYDLQNGLKIRGERWRANAIYGENIDQTKVANPIVIGQTLGHLLSCNPVKKRTKSSLVEPVEQNPISFQCDENPQLLQLSVSTVHGQMNAMDFSLVGLIDGGFKDVDARFINIGLDQAQQLLDTKDISHIAIEFKDKSLTKSTIQKLQNELDKRSLHLSAESWQNHPIYGDNFHRTMDLLSIFKYFVVSIVLTIATFSVLNTLIKVIKERTKEIGTFRSLGYFNSQIYQLFFYETIGLTALGTFFGAVFSITFATIIRQLGLTYKAGMFVEPSPLTIAIDLKTYGLHFIYLCILTCIACVFALRGTLKKKVYENFLAE